MMKVSLAQCVLSVLKNAAKTDIAVLVADAAAGLGEHEGRLMRIFTDKKIPFVIAFNKCDLLSAIPKSKSNSLYVSAKTGFGIDELKIDSGHFCLPPNTKECSSETWYRRMTLLFS